MKTEEWQALHQYIRSGEGGLGMKELSIAVEAMQGDSKRTGPKQKTALRKLNDLLQQAEKARGEVSYILDEPAF